MEFDPTTVGILITTFFTGIGGTFGYKKLRNGSSNGSAFKPCPKHAEVHDQMLAGKAEFKRINEKLDEQKELSKEHGETFKSTSLQVERIATTLEIMSKKGK